jgi:hypothetical protein
MTSPSECERESGDAAPDSLPGWAATALNGTSFRTSKPWRPRSGDWIAGTVVLRGRTRPSKFNERGAEYVDLKAEAGTLAGHPLVVDTGTASTAARRCCASGSSATTRR